MRMGEEAGARCGLEAATLEPLVRDVLGQPAAVLDGGWSCRPLGGGAGEGGSLYRVAGTARVGPATLPWALVLKVCGSGDASAASAWGYPPREALAYASGLLGTLPGGLTAPRCLAAEGRPDGTTWLWLEEVADDHPGPWPRDRFALAARVLGRFNGAYLAGAALPAHPWLSRGWLRGFVAEAGPAVAELEPLAGPAGPPLVRRLFPPRDVAEVRRLWGEREAFLSALDRLPQTVCHHDAFRRNLLSRRGSQGDELVAIDWASVGHGAVGEELAPLVLASLGFFEADGIAPRDLDAVCFAGYVGGLREAGWAGDERVVRLGFTAAAALRYTIGTLRLVLPMLAEPALHQVVEDIFGRPLGETVAAWAAIWPFQVGLAEEARALLPVVG
jgi:hypothetical protein